MKGAIPRREFLYGAVAAPCALGAEKGREGLSRLDAMKERLAGVPPRQICFERARLMTESYRRTEGEPETVRRAKAFLAVLEGIPVRIGEDELIVGNVSSAPRLAYFAPETFDWRGYAPDRDYVLGDPRFTNEIQIRYRIPEPIAAYWRDKPRASTVGHFVADYAKVLRKGFAGIRREIGGYRWRASLDGRKAAYYDAAELACRAAEVFAARHAEEARRLARQETDARRRKELETIAAICAKVPARPAETFQEALQSFWFTHILLHINSPEWSISPGRFDQYMWPYYRQDVEQGRLTRAQAEELLTCLWFKFNEVRINSVDFINYQNLMIGGTDAGGKDATNELSHLCIDVTRRVPYTQPSLSMRWHPGTPPELLQKAAGLILTGCGRPALFNDVVIVQALEAAGVALKDARDYAIAGCEEPSVPGLMFGVIRGGSVNQARCVLNALARFTGKSPAAGFDDILAAYREELRRASEDRVRICVLRKQGRTPHTPHPFASLLFEDCLARARDLDAGGVRYDIRSTAEAGTITAANALFAIKKAVFEEKIASLPELSEALRSNFEGHGRLRAYLLNRVPKFGNDVDEIDLFARRIAEWNDEVLADLSAAGGHGCRLFTGSGSSTAWLAGTNLEATPDGRLKGEGLSVNLGPSAGTDRNGPTAMLNSVAKLNWRQQVGGGLTAVKLPYTGSQSSTSVRALAALVQGFFRKGGMGLHFTVVDAGMLRAALKEPQKHLDLIVRVGGFSAPFVLLAPDVQKNILERAEQGLGL